MVRNDIKSFTRKKVTLPPGRHKIVILDEIDSMTEGAQQALRRVIEMNSDTTRFALACNFSSKVIEPIQSRCAILRYGAPSNKQVLQRLLDICKMENVNYVPEGLEALIFTGDGDMRRVINNLQSTVSGFNIVNAENAYMICDKPRPAEVRKIIKSCVEKKIEDAVDAVYDLYKSGYSVLDIVNVMSKVVKDYDIPSAQVVDFLLVVLRAVLAT